MFAHVLQQNIKQLTLIFVVALVLRALFFMGFTRHGQNAYIYVDSQQYLDIAANIKNGNGFCLNDGLQSYRLPGYPAFLLLPHALGIQIVLASLIPILLFLLSMALFPGKILVASIAAWASALHPGFILYAGMIATESLCVLLLLLFFIGFFLVVRMDSTRLRSLTTNGNKTDRPERNEPIRANAVEWVRSVFVSGIFLGLASLMRPVGHYVLIVALLFILFSSVPWKQKLCQGSWLTTGWLLVVGPWLLRNFLLTGAIFFHSLPGLHFLQYSAAHVLSAHEKIEYPAARAQLINQWKAKVSDGNLNEYEQCRMAENLALGVLKQHPLLALKYSMSELFKSCAGLYSAIILLADGAVWPDYGSQVTWKTKIKRFLQPNVKRWFLTPFIYLDILFLLLTIIGFGLFLLFCLNNHLARSAVLVMLPFIVLLMGLTVAYGGARLRMPAEPLLLLGAVYGWTHLVSKRKHTTF